MSETAKGRIKPFMRDDLLLAPQEATRIAPGGGTCFLVQFTQHLTYEMEVAAKDEVAAVQEAAQAFHARGVCEFCLVEEDFTDWTAVSLEPLTLDASEPATDVVEGSCVTPFRAQAKVSDREDVQWLVQLLYELRETTSSRSAFESASRIIQLLTK
jgi:hypothetical protein